MNTHRSVTLRPAPPGQLAPGASPQSHSAPAPAMRSASTEGDRATMPCRHDTARMSTSKATWHSLPAE